MVFSFDSINVEPSSCKQVWGYYFMVKQNEWRENLVHFFKILMQSVEIASCHVVYISGENVKFEIFFLTFCWSDNPKKEIWDGRWRFKWYCDCEVWFEVLWNLWMKEISTVWKRQCQVDYCVVCWNQSNSCASFSLFVPKSIISSKGVNIIWLCIFFISWSLRWRVK